MNTLYPRLEDIANAHDRIRNHIHITPVLTCTSIDALAGASVYFKCENFQKVGAFKFRGACNAVAHLMETAPDRIERGVATHSSGNHAAALACAAGLQGIKAYIVMPDNSITVKKAAVEGYGGRITYCKPTLADREETLKAVVAETGASIVHPYNDMHIISGQGTAAKELLEEIPDLDYILAPVGGGGLLSGTAIAAKGIRPQISVVGCEPEQADDAYRSFTAKKLIPSTHPDTVADGLRTSLGSITFSAIIDTVDTIVTVGEEAIKSALRLVLERMKIIIEPSSAVPVAALLSGSLPVKNTNVGVILSGGNVDLDNLPIR